MLQRVAPTNNGGAGEGGGRGFRVPVGSGPHCAIETAFQPRLVSVSSAAFGIHFDKICKGIGDGVTTTPRCYYRVMLQEQRIKMPKQCCHCKCSGGSGESLLVLHLHLRDKSTSRRRDKKAQNKFANFGKAAQLLPLTGYKTISASQRKRKCCPPP